jgi:hypothetical protein
MEEKVKGNMYTEESLRINTPNVVGEEFEGEVVVVNLESGCYFSLMGSAKNIWKTLAQSSASLASIIVALEETLDCSGIDVAAEVVPFLDELKKLELVVPTVLSGTTSSTAPEPPGASIRPRFEAPRVEIFTDLQDILLLDPIHDVDEAGWPMANPDITNPR